MTDRPARTDAGDLAELVGGLVRDSGRLLGQQIDLLRAELGRELRPAAGSAAEAAVGSGLAAAGGILTGLALVHLLHRATGLPLWACSGLGAAALGGAGAALLRAGVAGLADLRPLPQTASAVEENLEWLKEQVTPATR